MAYLNKMLDRGKRRKQFESFVLNADLNSGVYQTKTSENQRLITPPVIQSNSNDCISQFSTRCIMQRLTSMIKGMDVRIFKILDLFQISARNNIINDSYTNEGKPIRVTKTHLI